MRVRRQRGARRGIRRASAAPGRRQRVGRSSGLLGDTDRIRARPQLRRGGRAGAPLARGDVRDGGHGGACTGSPGDRRRRRRGAGGARARRRRHPAGAARAARRPARVGRRAPELARGLRPARAVAPGGARTACVARAVVDDGIRRGRSPGGGSPMTAEPIRVSPGWLELREGADAAAPSPELVEELRRRLAGGPWLIHALACGSGAMGRWLAPLLPGPQRWILHDRDADLLALAAAHPPGAAADGAPVAVETRLSDITLLGRDDLAGATLITASALLDLLTEAELAALIHACAGAGCPVLFSLSVTGRVDLAPPDQLDARVAAAFDAHQRRPTPRGRLLGPDAVEAALDGFRALGHEVIVGPSPWRLGAGETDLTVEWLAGWIGAACEQEPRLA